MHRLVIALTALLTLVGVAVIGAYLFLFAASADRTARAAPADSVAYATFYVQPSAGQRMNLAELLGRVPGLEDPLEQKVHEISQNLLGQAGIDYQADVRPWLGTQVALAVRPDGMLLALIDVKVPDAAADAMARMAAAEEADLRTEAHHGVQVVIGPEVAYAVTDDLLVVAEDDAAVRAALDADADRSPALTDDADFSAAMRRLPADHLAAAFIDFAGLGDSIEADEQLAGFDAMGLALVVEREGLRIAGSAPFDADEASAASREAFALASEPSSLADWMPEDTEAEAVVFGLAQSLQSIEEQIGRTPGLEEAADQLVQLRLLAALGLGVNLDNDILPLLNREAALALSGLDRPQPSAQLLLRPDDPEAAVAALERLQDGLESRGAEVESIEREATTITTVIVPDLPTVSYAIADGVVVLALAVDDVARALQAHADGTTLAASPRYQGAWELAGTRGGNELYVDVAALSERLATLVDLSDDGRDILHEVDALAVTAPARDDAIEFHLVLTAR